MLLVNGYELVSIWTLVLVVKAQQVEELVDDHLNR
jgi:hypothetical protein